MVVPQRLKSGDEVRVVAPSRSHAMITPELRKIARERFDQLGLRLSFGEFVEESDLFGSSSIDQRVSDVHQAFADPDVAAVLTVIGGHNANQILPYIDWGIIAANPKIFCGYSDITVLSCAIYAKTGLVTYSGPHYSTFAMLEHVEQTIDWFRSALFDGGTQNFAASPSWTDDPWFEQQLDRPLLPNHGHWVLNSGAASGTLIGGNLCTLNLLQGTEFMPSLRDSVIFIEDDYEAPPATFNRDLVSLTQLPDFADVRGVMIGRFQQEVQMSRPMLQAIVDATRALADIPVIANVDFGHTSPIMTIPLGGQASITALPDDSTELTINFG